MIKILFVIFLAIDFSALGVIIGRLSLDSSDAIIGGAVIFWYLLAGFAAGLTAGIILSGILSEKSLKILNSVLGIIAISFVTFIILRITF